MNGDGKSVWDKGVVVRGGRRRNGRTSSAGGVRTSRRSRRGRRYGMPIVGGVAEGMRVTGHLGQVRGGEGVVTEDPMLHPLSKILYWECNFFSHG